MKKFFSSILIVLLVFCFGCNRLPGFSQTNQPLSPFDMDFHKGTDGLAMSLVENEPPSEVWENSPFQIGVELRDKGVFDIQEGQLYVSGFKYISLNEQQRPAMFDLKGKSQFDPEGEFRVETFPVIAGEVADEDKIDSFVITACYKYGTEAGLEVCINPNLLDFAKLKQGECKPSSVSGGGGQGAPVAVTNVEEDFIPVKSTDPNRDVDTKVLFKIHISNSGGGKVVKSDAYLKECEESNPLDVSTESNVIHVKDVKFSKYSLATGSGDFGVNCTGFMNDGQNNLKISSNGEAVLSCSAILKDSNSYTTPLIVDLEYGYTSYITRSLTIKNIPGS